MTADTEPLRFLSYGGGTQSAALALMSAAGELDRLDAVIFADTGGELPATYEYAKYVEGHLDAAGIPFLRVTGGNLERAILGLEKPADSQYVLLPAHVRNADGTEGKVGRYTCSYDYKRRQVTRATKKLVGGRGAWMTTPRVVEQWLGFSVDEMSRAKPEHLCRCGHVRATHAAGRCGNTRGCRCAEFAAWRVNRFPLLELGFRRIDTIRWFGQNGHPTPPRSACWFCPNSGPGRWRELRDQHPELWQRAVAIDAAIRTADHPKAQFDGEKFLHRQRVPLDLVDLRTEGERAADGGQGALFDEGELANDCQAGVCFT